MLATLMFATMLAPEATVCGKAAAELVAYLKSPTNHGLSAETAVIVAGNAYAEHDATCGEECTATGEAALMVASGDRSTATSIAGASSVAVPGFTGHPLTFRLALEHGAANMRWTVLGKTFEAEVTHCSGGLWLAAQGSKSAIIVQLTKNPAPAK